MNHLVKSNIAALALGVVGLVLVSIAPATAAGSQDGSTAAVTRQPTPVVRDHRGEPGARDHRTDGKSGGVTVTDSKRPRGSTKCLGNLCNKKVCIGPACL